MGPDTRNQTRNPIQRLLETEEKGRGLALFGWAGVTVFAFLAAFASWEFSPTRGPAVARIAAAASGEVTGAIKPAQRSSGGRVATVPTPLPSESVASNDDIEQLRADLKDLRRMVGRIDVSTDVLARRISNLEDSVGGAQPAPAKSAPRAMQQLVPIVPQVPVAAAPPMVPAQSAAPVPSLATHAAPTPVPEAQTAARTPAQPAAPGSAAPTVASALTPPLASSPTPTPVPAAHTTAMRPPDPTAEKSSLDRAAVDRSTLEHMLLQRGQGLNMDDSDAEANAYIPPLPDPITVVPKSRQPVVLPPQTQPQTQTQTQTQPQPQPLARSDGKPVADVGTTGSVQPKPGAGPILPIDPTRAVVVRPATPDPARTDPARNDSTRTDPARTAAAGPAAAQAPGAKPDAVADLSPEQQRQASETMALAMRQSQPQTQPQTQPQPPAASATPAGKPEEIYGVDLGGFKSIGQVKKAWSDLEIRQTKLTRAMKPLARLSEGSEGVDIDLVIGPFTDREQAVRTCHQLRGALSKCDPVPFTGEPIETRPAPVTEHRPAQPEQPRKPIALGPTVKPLTALPPPSDQP